MMYLDSFRETEGASIKRRQQHKPFPTRTRSRQASLVRITGTGCQQQQLLNGRLVYHNNTTTTTMGQTTTATTTRTATTTTTKEPVDAGMKDTAATLVKVASSTKLLGNNRSTFSSSSSQQQQQAPKAYSVVMTTIGLGIDPFFGSSSSNNNNTNDATVAAVKAVRDAMERGVLRFPTDHTNLYLHIKLGVPPATTTTTTTNNNHATTAAAAAPVDAKPMHVDVGHLTPLLPSFIPLLPVEVVVGGLLVSNPNPGSTVWPVVSNATTTTTTKAASPPLPPGAACTAVACITLQRAMIGTAAATKPPAATMTPSSPYHATTTTTTGGDGDLLLHQQATAAANAAAAATMTTSCNGGASSPTSVAAAATNAGGGGVHYAPGGGSVGGSVNSVETSPLLSLPTTWAQVIAEDSSAAAAAAVAPPVPAYTTAATADASSSSSHPNDGTVQLVRRSTSIDMLARVSAELQEAQQQQEEEDANIAVNAANNYNYKKLPPGTTPKNNKRLFVQHSYRDFSQELPLTGEVDLMAPNAPQRTPNAAFPLKLHETLSQIESEGYQHIIGWLPHGRSFKIHQQKEFVEMILPKYFVMRKKSSFLRQLNLYGFNRLSGVGPDQGSYYHEKFLRGMKFLCRRIHRQKVNGNGIRAAGNPDAEPNLSRYPVCPAVRQQNHPLLAGTTTTTLPATNQMMPMQAAAPATAAVATAADTPPASPKERQPSRKVWKVVAMPTTTTAATVNGDSNSTRANNQLSPILVSTAALTSNLFSSAAPLEVLRTNGNHHNSSSGPHPSFPLKLHRILDKLEADGETDVIAWLSHGRAFLVRDVDRFVHELMPLYFNQTKYSSFQRQLHMYHFQRITSGRDKGAYHHPSFLRGRPELCHCMQRTRVNGKGTRRPGNAALDPDFYVMSPVPVIPRGTYVEIPHEIPALHAEDDKGDD